MRALREEHERLQQRAVEDSRKRHMDDVDRMTARIRVGAPYMLCHMDDVDRMTVASCAPSIYVVCGPAELLGPCYDSAIVGRTAASDPSSPICSRKCIDPALRCGARELEAQTAALKRQHEEQLLDKRAEYDRGMHERYRETARPNQSLSLPAPVQRVRAMPLIWQQDRSHAV
eukprot:3882745-Rhodomonas_salina.1